MAERIRWAILGNATIARKCVLPAIASSSNGRVYALATQRPSAVDAATASAFEKLYDDYDRAISDPAVDAVYVPLPNHLHHPWTIRALEAGKHVLCEKPLACNAQQAAQMASAARANDRVLMEAFMYRFHPRSRRIKSLLEQGAIGRPRWIHTAFCFRMDEAVLSEGTAPRLNPLMGGGALLDVGCYGVSVARWLLGAEPVRVQAQAIYSPSGVDIHLAASLRFEAEILATVTASFTAALQQTFTVVGTRGSIELPHDAFIPWEKDAVYRLRGKTDETGTSVSVDGADEYRLMVEHFADGVLKGRPLEFPPEESVRNMRVLDALARAARSGRTESLVGDASIPNRQISPHPAARKKVSAAADPDEAVRTESVSDFTARASDKSARLQWRSPFNRPEWIEAWWSVFGAGRRSWIQAVYHRNRLIGLAPMMVSANRLCFIGDPQICDYFDVAVDPQQVDRFCDLLLKHCRRSEWGSLDLRALRPDSMVLQHLVPAARSLGLTVSLFDDETAYELQLPGSWQNYLDMLSGKQRHEIRRKLRRLEEAGTVSFHRLDTEATVAGMQDFMRLFSANREDKAQFMTPQMDQFFRRLARCLSETNRFRLFVLRIDRIAAAAVVGFEYAQTLYLYNNGYDQRFSALSVGLLSKIMTIRCSIEAGLKRFDFMKGNEPYKGRLAGQPIQLKRCRIELSG